MDNNILQRLFGLIDYKTLHTIFKLGFLGNIALCFSDFSSLVAFIMPLDIAMIEFGGRYTKDVQEVYALYQYFIDNYVSLSKRLYLDKPMETWTMFNYLLNNGYLSKDKKFKKIKGATLDLYPLYGANIFAGTGVCRHISAMLSDILRTQGYEAYNLSCTMSAKSLWAKAVKNATKTHEEQLRIIDASGLDEEIKNNLRNYLYRRWELNRETDMVWEKSKFSLTDIIGNHVICFAEDENYSYFLDSMNSLWLEKDGKVLVGIKDNTLNKIKPKLAIELFLNELGKLSALEQSLQNSKPTMDKDQAREMVEGTNRILSNNKDVIESFYQENRELYEEVSDKLMRIRK